MAQRQNKPTPKSQRQISNENVQPFDKNVGNPNDAGVSNSSNKISWRGKKVFFSQGPMESF